MLINWYLLGYKLCKLLKNFNYRFNDLRTKLSNTKIIKSLFNVLLSNSLFQIDGFGK